MSDNKYQKLGKGLKDLLNTELPDQVEAIQKDSSRRKYDIDIKLISANPYQPRKKFDQSKLDELAQSIKEYGILTPILLRKVGDKYQIVAGERRFRAAQISKLKTVPAIIESFNDNQMMEIALIENIQREDLNVIEEARAFAGIQNSFKVTQDQLSKRLGKSRSYIANLLRLLSLPNNVQELLADDKITMGHARTLIGLNNQDIEKLAKEIIGKKLNVRETETLVNLHKKGKDKAYSSLEKKLSNKLKRKVNISGKTVKISFKDEKDLNKLIDELVK
jgi:ParB family transcriptional regulator, chromosome partitioning protein